MTESMSPVSVPAGTDIASGLAGARPVITRSGGRVPLSQAMSAPGGTVHPCASMHDQSVPGKPLSVPQILHSFAHIKSNASSDSGLTRQVFLSKAFMQCRKREGAGRSGDSWS
jgi:hypothetical protein